MLFLEVDCFWIFDLFLTSFLPDATLPFLDLRLAHGIAAIFYRLIIEKTRG